MCDRLAMLIILFHWCIGHYERLTRFTASQIVKVRKSNQVKSPSLLNQIKKSGKSAFMLDWQSSKALNTRVISGSYGFDE